jgi:hypothetical protein
VIGIYDKGTVRGNKVRVYDPKGKEGLKENNGNASERCVTN